MAGVAELWWELPARGEGGDEPLRPCARRLARGALEQARGKRMKKHEETSSSMKIILPLFAIGDNGLASGRPNQQG